MAAEPSPLVSVITPTYNHERFIGPCIESVLSQTYSNWEQIIVDDGSTDGTQSVVERYKDKRIRYIRQQNQGIEALAHTYNRALSASHGSLIAILEGDDLWPPEKLSILTPVFEDSEVILAYGEPQDVDVAGQLAKRRARSYKQRGSLPKAILFNDPIRSATAYLLSVSGQSLIPPSTVVLRRSALEFIGGFQYVSGKCPTDIPTFSKLSLFGKFYYCPTLLGYCRRHAGSATNEFLDVMPRIAEGFALSTSKDSRFGLTAAEQLSIKESWRLVPPRIEFTQGRLCLLRGNWQKARSHFSRAIKARDLRILLAATTGWTLSWLHTDLEGLFHLAGRATLRQRQG